MKRPQTHPLDRALSAAQQAMGNAEDVARLRSRLEAALAVEPPPSGPGGKTLQLSAAKIWLISGVALTAVGGWLVARDSRSVHESPATAAEVSAPAPLANTQSSAPAVAAQVEPTRPRELAPPSPPSAAKPAARGAPKLLPPPEPKAATGPAPSTLSEVELISRAQAAIERDPRAALSWLGQHEQHFGRGLLGEERDILRFDAERALGMEARALGHAQAFVNGYPNSSHRRRVEQWLIEHKNAPSQPPTH